jgi:DNA-binding response OmpR family regulator
VKKRILILEDDEQFQKSLLTILKDEGYVVEAASDGKKGLKLLADETFDLLITDIFMPENDGIGVLREIRNKYYKMQIITMSGGGRGVGPVEVLKLSELLGSSKVISKPFTKNEILHLVRELIGEPV